MTSFFTSLLNLILPPRCIMCGKIVSEADSLCEECFSKVNFISQPYCDKCGLPLQAKTSGKQICGKCIHDHKNPFRYNRAAIIYDDNSKNLILALKFMDKTENSRLLGKWLKIFGEDIFATGVDIIIPAPLHYKRLIKRRYNQSALLAREVSKLTGIPVDYKSLVKHKHTKPQVQFSGRARVSNVRNAFSVKYPNKIKGKRIVLIDDVMTTGSTLKECAKVLLKAGAKSVDTLTVARVC